MTDKQIIRELAKKYMELACSPEQQEMNARMQATNDLKIVRPPVLIDEIPWYQMDIDGELICRCQDPRARWVEEHFRRSIYRRKYFRADTLLDPFLRIPSHFTSTGTGWTPTRTRSAGPMALTTSFSTTTGTCWSWMRTWNGSIFPSFPWTMGQMPPIWNTFLSFWAIPCPFASAATATFISCPGIRLPV